MYGSRFNNKQLKHLVYLFNEEMIFQPAVDEKAVNGLFSCKLTQPLMVRDVRKLCYIMDQLRQKGMITPMWQAVSEKQNCFMSLRGKPISRNTLSSAKYCAINEDNDYHRYAEYINIVARM
ncbi:MAG: hypothetical protein LUF90_08995 [Rikenellaceae bacterium]|nr:hypothetical protein [Rikenellaceae bacterium]